MNFLAHAYLSFGKPEILVGNMISDFVKGKQRYNFPQGIQQGIELHRSIDAFTDQHTATRSAKEYFRKDYRLYSGPIVDIVYDHFLARDENIFPENSLLPFTENIYKILETYIHNLPVNFIAILHYMKSENWLYSYKYETGLQKTLKGFVRRSKFLAESETASNLYHQHYHQLQNCYTNFFEDVKIFSEKSLNKLLL